MQDFKAEVQHFLTKIFVLRILKFMAFTVTTGATNLKRFLEMGANDSRSMKGACLHIFLHAMCKEKKEQCWSEGTSILFSNSIPKFGEDSHNSGAN